MSSSDKSINVEHDVPTVEDIPIVSKPSDDTGEVPGEEAIDPIILKQRQTTAVGKVTRKRNDLVKLMLSADNLHEVKTQLTEYDQLFVIYQGAHNMLYDALTNDDVQDKESKRYREHEAGISTFRQQVLDWITGAERKLSDELDRLSEIRSRRSGSTHVSRRSKSGSTQSARAHEKAKLAALLVEREQQSKQWELQTKKQTLLAEEQKLQLDLEISKTLAREHAYAEELETEMPLKHDYSSLYVEPDTPKHENVHVAMNEVSDNVATNVATDVATNVATNVAPNAKSIDDKVTQNNISHVQAEAIENLGHLYVNAINNNPVTSAGVSSITTIHHDMRIPEPTSNRVSKTQTPHNHQSHDVRQTSPTFPAYQGTTSHLPRPGTTHILNPSAACYQPTPHVGQFDFQATIQQLVTAMTLPQPEVPRFSGDPTEYHTFMMAFDARIVSRTASYPDCLYYLNQYLEGEAKDFISGCLHMDPTFGYPEARRILHKEYGDMYKISSAYIDKIMSWSTIKHDDSLSLRKFAIFLNKCLKAMNNISNLTVLNHMPNLQVIVSKLPGYLQNKWREQANRIKRHDDRTPNFHDLTSFVETASESANDPVFGKTALTKYSTSTISSKPVNKWNSTATRKSFAITLNQPDIRDNRNTYQSISHINTNKCICHLCHKPHDLDVCYAFLRKTIDERRAFLMDKRLCFACFGTNHTSKGCSQKRTCKKCNMKHPTSLHMDNYQPNRSNNNRQSSQPATITAAIKPDETIQTNTCCITNEDNSPVLQAIIPVKVHQQGRDKCIITYAFYDNGSTACFFVG